MSEYCTNFGKLWLQQGGLRDLRLQSWRRADCRAIYNTQDRLQGKRSIRVQTSVHGRKVSAYMPAIVRTFSSKAIVMEPCWQTSRCDTSMIAAPTSSTRSKCWLLEKARRRNWSHTDRMHLATGPRKWYSLLLKIALFPGQRWPQQHL